MEQAPGNEDRGLADEKSRAWRDLGWGIGWSFLLLVLIIALMWSALALEGILPSGAVALLFFFSLAAIIQLVFLYPVFSAMGTLFKIYVGRRLRRLTWVRWLVWSFLAVIVVSGLYQAWSDLMS